MFFFMFFMFFNIHTGNFPAINAKHRHYLARLNCFSIGQMFGASTEKSKNVVQNARQAREERALLKRKEVALLKIQALVRGFIARLVK